MPEPEHIVESEPLEVKKNLAPVEEPTRILETQEWKLRIRTMPHVKVLWKHHKVVKATSELKHKMREMNPQLFASSNSNFEVEIFLREE